MSANTNPAPPGTARRLRILYIVESAATGVGRHVIDMAASLTALGHHVDVIYSPLREDGIFRDGRAALSSVRFDAVPMGRNPGPADLAPLLAIRRLMRANGPYDIVHGHSSKGGMMARLAALGSGARVVFTPHAISTLDPLHGQARRLVFHAGEWALAWLTDAIIAVSRHERDHIHGLGVRLDMLAVIPNGVDPPRCGPRPEVRAALGVGEDAIVIGFVGRLSRQKAIDIMIDSFAPLAAEAPQLRLAVIGEGEAGPAARAAAAQAGCDGQIIWLGAVDAHWYYGGFDLLALPSRYEGFSYTVLEAAAAGLPIVATDVGGVSDVVSHGQTGLIVPPGDAAPFTAALRRACLDPAARAALAAAAREGEATRNGRARMVAATEALYQRVLAGGTAGQAA